MRGALDRLAWLGGQTRRTAASQAIAAGEPAEEVGWQLGHRSATVPAGALVGKDNHALALLETAQWLHARLAQLLEVWKTAERS